MSWVSCTTVSGTVPSVSDFFLDFSATSDADVHETAGLDSIACASSSDSEWRQLFLDCSLDMIARIYIKQFEDLELEA